MTETRSQIEKVTVLINPMAGHGHAPAAGRKGVARLRARGGVAVTEIIGTDADDAKKLARRAIEEGTDALVVVGGDGAISIGLQAAALTDTPIGLIPAAPVTITPVSSAFPQAIPRQPPM